VRAVLIAACILVLFTLGIAIGYANNANVQFDYLIGSTEINQVSLLLFVFGGGVGLTLLACAGRLLALRSELRRARRQLRDAEAELKNLRNLPPVR
jgi:putative membrane protein